ncbi:MAG: hypothetical protein R2851_17270 [Caldilineaceae bacterium]
MRLEVPILGVIENMSGEIFGSGGGERAAQELGVEYLGQVELIPASASAATTVSPSSSLRRTATRRWRSVPWPANSPRASAS